MRGIRLALKDSVRLIVNPIKTKTQELWNQVWNHFYPICPS